MRNGSFNYWQQIPAILLLIFSGNNAYAQDPVFVVKTSGQQIAQHGVFSVQFELKNATASKFEPPSFKDFKIVGGPATSSSTMIVNGVKSQSQTWTYSILATKQGKQTIDGAKVVVGRNTYVTKPFQIEVLPPSSPAQQNSSEEAKDPVFLTAELNDSVYYPGQQIILTYKLLFKENVQTVNPMAEDDYADFFVQHFANLNPLAEYVTINGVQYTSRVVKSLALYAHQSGTYELDPLIMTAGISAPFESNRGFFSMRRVNHVQVASSPVTIQVDPLPSDIPDSFSGAVGQYQMRVSAPKKQITTNDAFTFYLEVTGNGDSRRWELPSPQVDGEFEVYDPKILKDEEFEMNEQMNQRRTVSYQMIPSSAGHYSVYIPFTFFDPISKSFVTIHSDTMDFSALQGQKKSIVSDAGSEDSGLPELMQVRKPWFKDQFWFSIPHLLLFSLVLSGSGIGFFRVWRYEREKGIPEAKRASRDAGQKANEKLNTLEERLEGIPDHEFFGSATEIFYSFLMERFTIPSSELDEAGLATYLAKAKIADAQTERTKKFFSQCLTVRYGGTPGGMSKSEMMHTCREVIDALQA